MRRRIGSLARPLFLLAAGLALGWTGAQVLPASRAFPAGWVIQNDRDVAHETPGPHGGGGRNTGYFFFWNQPEMPFVFRKRTLHPGSAIGYHPHTGESADEEVYYVVEGEGEMTLDGIHRTVGPGDAVLVRPGSSHGLEPAGPEGVTVVIVYPTRADTTSAAETPPGG